MILGNKIVMLKKKKCCFFHHEQKFKDFIIKYLLRVFVGDSIFLKPWTFSLWVSVFAPPLNDISWHSFLNGVSSEPFFDNTRPEDIRLKVNKFNDYELW